MDNYFFEDVQFIISSFFSIKPISGSLFLLLIIRHGFQEYNLCTDPAGQTAILPGILVGEGITTIRRIKKEGSPPHSGN